MSLWLAGAIMSDRKEFDYLDYLIVGAGSAGCVFAAVSARIRLSEWLCWRREGKTMPPKSACRSFLSCSRPSTRREFNKEPVLLHGYCTVCCHARAIDAKPRGSDEPSAVAN